MEKKNIYRKTTKKEYCKKGNRLIGKFFVRKNLDIPQQGVAPNDKI